jgi:hypothetical protein
LLLLGVGVFSSVHLRIKRRESRVKRVRRRRTAVVGNGGGTTTVVADGCGEHRISELLWQGWVRLQTKERRDELPHHNTELHVQRTAARRRW